MVAATPSPAPESLLMSLDCLSVRQRAAQMLLPLATQSELAGAHQMASAGELGGIGLLGLADNGLAGELVALQQASFVSVLVASDEEGGEVQRLSNVLGSLPSAASNAATRTPDEVRLQFEDYGRRARALGIDVIFGPVLDVGSGPGIESRSFSDDPDVVIRYGRALPTGCGKPGSCRSSNTSQAMAEPLRTRICCCQPPRRSTSYAESTLCRMWSCWPIDRNTLRSRSCRHLSVPGLSNDVPTSLSPETVDGLCDPSLDSQAWYSPMR